MLKLQMIVSGVDGLASRCQIARRITEAWTGTNLYCVACQSDRIAATPNNTQAVDFRCGQCDAPYQLKASRKWSELRIPDAGYDAMMRALRSDRVPNLLVMQYTEVWAVHNLLLVPSFFFSPAAVEKRAPLAPAARRAGWVGCNILLREIADEGKIRLVTNGSAVNPADARATYARVKPLSSIRVAARGWTLDVLRIVERMGMSRFDLADVYSHEGELARMHPANRHIRPKIRQQLQVLRDLGFIRFRGDGSYCVIR